MNWRLKGTVQKVLGALPRGGELHYFLQHSRERRAESAS
jgi:hypothetical protein